MAERNISRIRDVSTEFGDLVGDRLLIILRLQRKEEIVAMEDRGTDSDLQDAHCCLVYSQGKTSGSLPAAADAITVEAWVRSGESRAEVLQVIAAQWSWRERMDAFATYDAGNTGGLETKGFFGAVFDGRYVYFSPQYDGRDRHGKALRYDTRGDFQRAESWAAHDAGNTSNLRTRGYYGAVFDGRYVYFVPRFDGVEHHSRILRYDAQGEFADPGSWSAHDAGLSISYQSAAFDGRFIYFAPGYHQETGPSGEVLRYDTRGEFADPDSYATYDAGNTSGLMSRCYDGAVFDGRYVYFAPLGSVGIVLRCDTQGEFTDPESWSAHDAGNTSGLEMGQCVGAVFDGRYVYFTPYANSVVVRCDTQGEFTDSGSWSAHDAGNTSGLKTRGYDGAAFDGRYVYFIPFWEGEDVGRGFHARLLRYDARGEFTDLRSWDAADGGNTIPANPGGFNGGAFDGRYLYMAPWREGTGEDDRIISHGKVLRYDTAGEGARFVLKYMDCGHNGGLCAAVPGPVFTVNTQRGPVSARGNANPGPGWRYLAGTYDGVRVRLFIDGERVDEQEGAGRLASSSAGLSIGRTADGLGFFEGTVGVVRISDVARSGEWIRNAFREQRDFDSSGQREDG